MEKEEENKGKYKRDNKLKATSNDDGKAKKGPCQAAAC